MKVLTTARMVFVGLKGEERRYTQLIGKARKDAFTSKDWELLRSVYRKSFGMKLIGVVTGVACSLGVPPSPFYLSSLAAFGTVYRCFSVISSLHLEAAARDVSERLHLEEKPELLRKPQSLRADLADIRMEAKRDSQRKPPRNKPKP